MRAQLALLEDEHETLWPVDVMVLREIARYRGEQTLRLVRHEDAYLLRDRGRAGGGADPGAEDEEAEELGTGTLLKMLGGGSSPQASGGAAVAVAGGGRGGDGGGGGDEEDAEAQEAAMAALAALGDDDDDSDDDDNQRKEYVEPELNLRREIKDLIIHSMFLVLLLMSSAARRSIVSANSMVDALETIFIQEEFGDFKEKVRTRPTSQRPERAHARPRPPSSPRLVLGN